MNSLRQSTLLLTILAIFGCGDRKAAIEEAHTAPTTPPEVSITVWPDTRKTDQGSYSITLAPSEGPIERNKHFSLELSVAPTNEAQSAGEDLEITVDADMPAHRHGMNTKPELSKTGGNTYRVDGMLFHMGGDWVITVKIGGGSGAEQAAFPLFIER